MPKQSRRWLAILFLLGTSCAGLVAMTAQASSLAGTRYFAPASWTLGPMVGYADYSSNGATDSTIMDQLDADGIPFSTFHFDGWGWETCNNNGQLKPGFAPLIQKLAGKGRRALFWIVPLISTSCSEYNVALNNGYFVKNGQGQVIVTPSNWWEGVGSWVDFNNPAAVAYWHSLLDGVVGQAGGVMGGFYTDDVRPDLVNDTTYSDLWVKDLLDYTRSKVADGDVVMKHYGENTPSDSFLGQYGHTSYVGNTTSDFAGMRDGVSRLFGTTALMPAGYNEFSGYGQTHPSSENYIRRSHFGALQAVMEDDPSWPPYFAWLDANVLPAYKYYMNLHAELIPYLHSLDTAAYLAGAPQTGPGILRQSSASSFSTQIGDGLFASYVVTAGINSLTMRLPAGGWINYWNEGQLYTGPASINISAPLGSEPTFIANGAIIPMNVTGGSTSHGTTSSAGSLTVNVFPNGNTSFTYYDSQNISATISSQLAGSSLTLCTLPPPAQPVIYRVGRWPSAPASVTQSGSAVGIDTNWGGSLPQLGSEMEVDGSTAGWYYDPALQHLYVKVSQLTNSCTPTTPTNTPTQTSTSTATNTSTSIPSNTPTQTSTSTATNTSTSTPSNTPTRTSTSTPSNTLTSTPSNTPTSTPTNTATNTATGTPSNTPTRTSTSTPSSTPTPSNTLTSIPSNTPTSTPTHTATNTATSTPSNTPTRTSTSTATFSPTPTLAATGTSTPSPVATATPRPGCTIWSSADVPKAIPDNNLSGVVSLLTVSGPGAPITDLTVRIDQLIHPYDSDLAIYLDAPNGTELWIVNNVGAPHAQNFAGTLLNDSAGVPIGAGSAPFTGLYHPHDDLFPLFGLGSAGVWKLRVADLFPGDIGILNAWSLEVCGPGVTPTPTWTSTATNTPTGTATLTPTGTLTSTRTVTPSVTPSPPPTSTGTPTAFPSSTATDTPTSTATSTATALPTATPSFTPTSTAAPEPTATATATVTATSIPVGPGIGLDLPILLR